MAVLSAAVRPSSRSVDTRILGSYSPTQNPGLLSGAYRSGQTGQTVNLLAYAFVGSNPTAPTSMKKDREALASRSCASDQQTPVGSLADAT